MHACRRISFLLLGTFPTALVLALAFVSTLRAEIYYVDCQSGRDSNDGLSPLRAWQTIDRANQPTYRAGDSILLKRGCVWRGAGFKAKGNGAIGTPIVLANY